MFATFICLFALSVSNISSIDAVIQDFYWRDFIPGDIPCDAFEGSDGRYIGQVNYQAHNFVATLYPYNNQAVIEFGKKIVIKENIKILCCQNCNRFYWEYVKFNSEHDDQMKNAVKGGFQSDFNLFIGKVIYEGEWRIGKVVEISHGSKGLWIWNDKGAGLALYEFYLLKYNTTLECGFSMICKN